MKDPRITTEQSTGIRDVVNDQGFATYYRAISNTVSHFKVFQCERSRVWIFEVFSYVECFRSKLRSFNTIF